MNVIRRNGHWMVLICGMVCLTLAAGVMAQKTPELKAPSAKQADEGVADAHELSAAFRRVAKEALPAMVSIQTRGKAVQVRGGREMDLDDLFGDNSPFGEMFKNDPRMKEFFRRAPRQQMPETRGMGSGFIIDSSGVILTASHVVADADSVLVKLHDGREYTATEVKSDPRTDVAIVRIAPEGPLTALPLGNSDEAEIGDWVLAIGSPFGLDMTVTAGIISAKGRGPGIAEREDFIQTDAAINPGNSGGPLIDLHGRVVGVNTAISTRSGGYDGVGFAVPINLAHWVSDQLVTKGAVSRAYVGVAIQEVNSDLAKQLNVPVGSGALVTQIVPGSPAAEAKLEPGDLVLKLDGKDVHGPRDMQGIVERLKTDATYPLTVLRNGKEMTLKIKVREMPKEYSLANSETLVPNSSPGTPESGSFAEIGIEIQGMTADVAKQLGYKETPQGVLITSVKDDSPAAQAGLREGQVIEKVGARKVTSPDEFKAALKEVSLEKGILVLVLNQRGTQFVVVKK
jgi:serine protease Do